MEATPQPHTAFAVQDLQRALAMLDPYRSASTAQPLATAYLTIESAMELLCDARQHRAVLLLHHALKVLGPVVTGGAGRAEQAGEIEREKGMAVTRHLGSALCSLGTTVN
jgi:hypothetical protein